MNITNTTNPTNSSFTLNRSKSSPLIQEKIQNWMDIARWAPSGGNAQPWNVDFFEDNEDIILKLSIPSRYIDLHSPLDVNGTAAVIALGCLAVNFESAAGADGYHLIEEECTTGSDYWNSYVQLRFQKSDFVKPEFTKLEMTSRHTNRNKFSTEPLPQPLIEAIEKLNSCDTSVSLVQLHDKNLLIENFSLLETIRLQMKPYFKSFLSEVDFDQSKKSLHHSQDKIPISQLGISKMDQLALKLMKNISWAHSIFAASPFPSLIAKKTFKQYVHHCSRVYILQAHENSFSNCFAFGKMFQKIWLESTRAQVAFQPLGIPLLALGYWQQEPYLNWSKKNKNTILKVSKVFLEKFSIDLKRPTMAFRLGKALKETERTRRFNLGCL